MIERIPDLPDNVPGFTARAKVTAQDYENTLIPAVERYFAEHKNAGYQNNTAVI